MRMKEREVSTRLIRPSQPHLDIDRLLLFIERWDSAWELDGSVKIFDEGIAQYKLVDVESHYKYFAALVLNKPSLRCQIVDEEPDDILDDTGNIFQWSSTGKHSSNDEDRINYLRNVLAKRGYRFQ